jgi:hypothetical protein
MGSRLSSPAPPDPLAAQVYDGSAYKPFGAFTIEDALGRAQELGDAAGWGPTARVAPVARGWRELARAMTEAGAAVVSELEPERAAEFARRVWAVPPGGSLI